jgi:D-3-phosphoglycerate dehydrogenase
MDIFVSTAPFGITDPAPRELLDQSDFAIGYNEFGRKCKPEELAEIAVDCPVVIAGTENLLPLIERSTKLQMISRVGIGLDSVPLELCRERGIRVSYTPDAVTMAVVELTLGLMLDATRRFSEADRRMREGTWQRITGRRLEHSIIGLLGFGRIGSRVAHLLVPFRPVEVLVHDQLDKSADIERLRQQGLNVRQTSKAEVLAQAQIISVHVPLSRATKHWIAQAELSTMREDAVLINTARGGILDEGALLQALREQRIAGSAVDVFEQEPYSGPLLEMENVILTPHQGSCSIDCRLRMERESAEEALRFLRNEPLQQEVPESEYEYQL